MKHSGRQKKGSTSVVFFSWTHWHSFLQYPSFLEAKRGRDGRGSAYNMDEEYDVIVLGTGLTVSSRASSAFLTHWKLKWLRGVSTFFFLIIISARLTGPLSSSPARSESLLHPCVSVTLSDNRCAFTNVSKCASRAACAWRAADDAAGRRLFFTSPRPAGCCVTPSSIFLGVTPVCHGPSLHRQASILRLAQAWARVC